MRKIVLVSDSHLREGVLKRILDIEKDADHYIHCGDSELMENEIRPFISVRGNNDYYGNFRNEMILKIEGHKILITHGHHYYISFYSLDDLIERAKELNADVVFFGHLHVYIDLVVDDIHLINPGSCNHNRDYSEPSYCVITIDEKDVKVERKEIPYTKNEKRFFW